MFTTREKLALSAVLALAVACRLDKLFKTPRLLGLGVSPPRVTESADSGSGEVRSLAQTIAAGKFLRSGNVAGRDVEPENLEPDFREHD